MFKKKLPLLAAAGAGAILVFGVLFTYLLGGGLRATEELNLAMRLLDEGRWDIAGRIARDLEDARAIDPAANASWNYVQGVSNALSVGGELDTPRNRRILLAATENLAKAEELGFPLGYQGKGKFYLGWCYFNTYQWDAVNETLADAEKLWPQRRSDAFRMMVVAYLRTVPAQLDMAQQRLDQWEKIPGMSKSELARISLSKAQLAFQEEDNFGCEESLLQVGSDTPEYIESQLWRGRWRAVEASQLPESSSKRELLLSEAQQIFGDIVLSPLSAIEPRRQAMFLSAKGLRMMGKLNEALGMFSSVRQGNSKSAEAIASGLEEAEILMELDRKDESLSTCKLLLKNVEDLALYNGLWLSIEELRSRLLDLGRSLLREDDFRSVVKLAEHLAMAFPLSDSVRLKAEAYEQWGDRLNVPTAETNPEQQRQAAHSKYLAAANEYAQLAQLELTSSEYPDVLWQAIQNYQRADDLNSANRLLTNYLQYEERPKRPRGYLALSRNRLNAAKWQSAVAPLERCLNEYPGHPSLFEARLLAAKAYSELNKLDEAAELLESNVLDYDLEPNSDTWRDCLFQWGHILYKQGNQLLLDMKVAGNAGNTIEERQAKILESQQYLLDAIRRLGHAVTRFAEDPRHYETRYMLGKSNRLAGETFLQLANSQEILVDSARRDLLQKRKHYLDQAAQEFRFLHQSLSKRQTELDASEHLQSLLRNCYFGEADTLFDLERWEDAMQVYRNAASRYMNRPEALEALMQLVACHQKMGDEAEASRTLAQAEQVLKRIPPELDNQFAKLTRANRAEWTDLLKWLRR
ncbi:tetratricopeptide repeat protein [Aureliella helgolandensis]|uniref:Anaphase-promoting complex, cyclosome, subunit 3 n=1 Tax=Aureliella helgolandensis TaxID=2527968 RepID=A0A518GFA3_9BACT|nr:hypothetical protein [Aureliella helgolandensis]QDV27238.1 Anaphase-promoting complex, cyclosome, subunit 3 [Aureliella helgolandensis]